MAWFGGKVQRQSSKAAIVFGVIAIVAFMAPSIVAAVGSKNETVEGLGILLSMGLLACAVIGVIVSLIVRVARKAPAQPNPPMDDSRQPAWDPHLPQEAPAGLTPAMVRPRTVLGAVAIAVALAAWQLWVGFMGLNTGRLMVKSPSLFPNGMPMSDAKWVFGVIFGFVIAVAIPLLAGVIQAYRGYGRVLTCAAWLYVALCVPDVILDFSGDAQPFKDVVALLAAVAVIILQRQSASKTYYANHRRQTTRVDRAPSLP